MIAVPWLMLSSLLYSLQLSSGSFPRPLTREEESHYLELAAKGDLDARNVLVERNLRLVAHIMKKYYTLTSDQEDLISIGTIGLMKGISTFDPSKGARLATYAARCVENAILSQMRLFRRSQPPGPPRHPHGGYSQRFRTGCTSFAPLMMAMYGLLPYISIVSGCAPRTSCWKQP